MDHFTYRQRLLHAESVPLDAIARAVGTPCYVYSRATLLRHAAVFQEAVSGLKARVCFAVKANSNLAVLALLGRAGLGADVVSGGELRRALKAGIAAENIVFSGVGKTAEEMAFALEAGIFQFNLESDREALVLDAVAARMGCVAPVAFRVNPDVDAGTHEKISTGKAENKFGIAMARAEEYFTMAHALPHVKVQGISVHIGSQLTQLAPFETAYRRVLTLAETLRARGIPIQTLDLGGGLGVPYQSGGETPPLPLEYGAMVRGLFADADYELIFEPGRLIAANAGILLSTVLYVKEAARTYAIVDAGMNDLMRPALYNALHEIVPVEERMTPPLPTDVVGPVCESSCVFARDFPLPPLREGELIAFRSAGAYGASMAGSYNSRLLVPEVMVDGAQFAVIRARPDYDALMAGESTAFLE